MTSKRRRSKRTGQLEKDGVPAGQHLQPLQDTAQEKSVEIEHVKNDHDHVANENESSGKQEEQEGAEMMESDEVRKADQADDENVVEKDANAKNLTKKFIFESTAGLEVVESEETKEGVSKEDALVSKGVEKEPVGSQAVKLIRPRSPETDAGGEMILARKEERLVYAHESDFGKMRIVPEWVCQVGRERREKGIKENGGEGNKGEERVREENRGARIKREEKRIYENREEENKGETREKEETRGARNKGKEKTI
eukprot:gene16036-7381_t